MTPPPTRQELARLRTDLARARARLDRVLHPTRWTLFVDALRAPLIPLYPALQVGAFASGLGLWVVAFRPATGHFVGDLMVVAGSLLWLAQIEFHQRVWPRLRRTHHDRVEAARNQVLRSGVYVEELEARLNREVRRRITADEWRGGLTFDRHLDGALSPWDDGWLSEVDDDAA